MSFFPYTKLLLAQAAPADADVEGPTFAVVVDADTSGREARFLAFVDGAPAGGSGSLIVQTSHDGQAWFDVGSVRVSGNAAVHRPKDLHVLGPFVRAIAVGTGFTGTVKLACNKPFDLLIQ